MWTLQCAAVTEEKEERTSSTTQRWNLTTCVPALIISHLDLFLLLPEKKRVMQLMQLRASAQVSPLTEVTVCDT